tara:strand:- start:2315 stop:3652 length:1338 start_codon:yes stop_codon:yes gene_type:complete
MARFGRDFVRAATQPAYLQGLFTAAQQVGAAPRRRRAAAEEERKREEEKARLRGVTGGLFGLEQAITQGVDPSDAIGSLVASGATPEQIEAAQERGRAAKKRTEEEARLGREKEAIKRLTSAAFMKAAQSKDPVSSEAFVRSLVDTQDLEGLRKFLGPKAEGTKAKANVVTDDVLENGKLVKYSVSLDPYTGTEISRVKIGEKPAEKEDTEEVDLGLDTKWGFESLREAREKGRDAEANALLFSDLATEAGQRKVYQRGFLGRTLSNVEESLGVAGQATIHRNRINKIRMSGALELLPVGPASDRDVELAMNASIDPNNLSNEEAESYLRGMAKIAQAEAEYYNRKRDFIQETKDPNAVGYDFWVKKEALNRDLEEMKAMSPEAMQAFREKVTQANSLENAQERQAALNALSSEFSKITNLMRDIEIAEGQWENFSRGKNLKGFY